MTANPVQGHLHDTDETLRSSIDSQFDSQFRAGGTRRRGPAAMGRRPPSRARPEQRDRNGESSSGSRAAGPERQPGPQILAGGAGLVPVELTATDAASTAPLRVEVTRQGGRVTGGYGDTVLASIPVSAIRTLANARGLFRMNVQPVAHADRQEQDAREKDLQEKGDAGTDLAATLGLNALHAAGIRGKGVRIGIIDFGFSRYDELTAAGKLPRAAAARAFNASGRLEGDHSSHGTACAEIIHAVAPDAELILASTAGNEAEIRNAADWMISQRVRMISFSGGFTAARHDGRSSLDRLVDSTVRQNHILWVNSAGNSATEHWMGDAARSDSDGWVQVSPQSGGKLILRPLSDDNQIDVEWDDWGQNPNRPVAAQGVDAFLFQADGTGASFRQVADRAFDNRGMSLPLAGFAGLQKGQIYALGLRAPGVSRTLRVHVFARNFQLLDTVPEGSMNIPGTAGLSLSVGAANIRTAEIEQFSSRGPTDDGRSKPDIAAYDGMRLPVFPNGFFGRRPLVPRLRGSRHCSRR